MVLLYSIKPLTGWDKTMNLGLTQHPVIIWCLHKFHCYKNGCNQPSVGPLSLSIGATCYMSG